MILLLIGNDPYRFAKAFENMKHESLLKKWSLSDFQISKNWFEFYLSSRSYQVNIPNKYCSIDDIKYRVTQGNILAPLLFVLYINDMNQAINCELFPFVDNSCLDYHHIIVIIFDIPSAFPTLHEKTSIQFCF